MGGRGLPVTCILHTCTHSSCMHVLYIGIVGVGWTLGLSVCECTFNLVCLVSLSLLLYVCSTYVCMYVTYYMCTYVHNMYVFMSFQVGAILLGRRNPWCKASSPSRRSSTQGWSCASVRLATILQSHHKL